MGAGWSWSCRCGADRFSGPPPSQVLHGRRVKPGENNNAVAPFTVFDPLTGSLSTLVNGILATNSGIVVDAASISLRLSGPGAVSQYDATVGAPLGIGAGLLLTSGITPGTSNTSTWYGADNSGSSGFTNGDADIDSVVNTVFQTLSYYSTTLAF